MQRNINIITNVTSMPVTYQSKLVGTSRPPHFKHRLGVGEIINSGSAHLHLQL